jgi:hypothetical protein
MDELDSCAIMDYTPCSFFATDQRVYFQVNWLQVLFKKVSEIFISPHKLIKHVSNLRL